MKIGIDAISFQVPYTCVDLKEVAQARGTEPEKYITGLGQTVMSVCPPTQDIVSMALSAATRVISQVDVHRIKMVLFATESGVDYSKSAATIVHGLLGLNAACQCVELKQACYSATFALDTARNHITRHPDDLVLVIASDIARYGLGASGEPTQGAGAIAMLISKDPRLAVISETSSVHTEDIYDFYRPDKQDTATVDGHYSNRKYLDFFRITFTQYCHTTESLPQDFAALCFHVPYTKIGKKAIQSLASPHQERWLAQYERAAKYNTLVGNIYTGSLYLNFLSLLENGTLEAGSVIGMFSYGSGAVSEFYTLTLQEDYARDLFTDMHRSILENRTHLDVDTYERVFDHQPAILPEDPDRFQYLGHENGRRLYQDTTLD